MKYEFLKYGPHKTGAIALFEKEIALPGKASIVFLRKASKVPNRKAVKEKKMRLKKGALYCGRKSMES